jgi:predicted DNA-binding protein YlxM (UPF0122 family)
MSSNEQSKITATLSLTKDQWEYMASHIMNDLSMLEIGLGPQIGRNRMTEIVSNGLKIVNQIKQASGIDIDLSEWELRYGKINE